MQVLQTADLPQNLDAQDPNIIKTDEEKKLDKNPADIRLNPIAPPKTINQGPCLPPRCLADPQRRSVRT